MKNVKNFDYCSRNMLEILCKVSFFLSMLVAYTYVTSTSKVIAIVLVYSLCVFSYYYFNVIQSAIDDFFKFINFNEKFNGNINPTQVPIPYVNPVESASYHNIKYPSLRQMSNYRFDKSTLRHLSKVPRINSTPAAVRIAPPEPISVNHLNLNDKYITNNDRYSDGIKNDKYLQVLREISRKRNYQEESDRIDSTPKKSRKNDIRNFTTSQSKRSHDDSSYDNLEDTSRKKRCSDSDRSVAKILSYTSSLMHVVAPNFTWNNISKKRKSSRIEKSTNESPEKVEKVRKINHEEITEDTENYRDEQIADNRTYVVEQQTVPVEVHENSQFQITNADECDSRSIYEPPLPDDDGEYVKVASGKILNRTNCMYRRKLNSNRIDPQSIITLEPELVNGYSNEDDEAMKSNLVRNLIDDIERKGEKDESVIFYENSIVEEIAKNRNKIESAKPEVIPNNPPPSTFNPLLSKPASSIDAENKPAFGSTPTPGSSIQSPPAPKQLELPSNITFGAGSTNTQTKPDCNPISASSAVFSSSVLNNSTFNANPVGSSTFNSSQTSNSFAFGSNSIQGGLDTVDSSPQSIPSKPEEKQEQNVTTPANNSNNGAVSFTSSAVTTAETTTVASSPKSGFLFPCVVSTAPFPTLANSTSMVNSASFNVSVSSTQQSSPISTVVTTRSEAPVMAFGAATTSPFSFGATKNDAAKTDSSSSMPQFGNAFATSGDTSKPAESVQKNPLSSITMFGNTAISTSATGSSSSNAVCTSSNSVLTFTCPTPSSGFQFGQSSTPSTNASAGFSFGSATNSANSGFNLGTTTSAPAAFSVPTPAFGTTSTSSLNTTPTLSFASSAPAAFSTGSGLKFEAKPSQPASSFSTSLFSTTTTASSFVTPSVPSFGNSQDATFGLTTSGGFGTTSNPSQGNSAFGNTPSTQPSAFGAVSTPTLSFGNTATQPQTTPAFGTATTQSTPTFGTSQPPANSTFGTATTQSTPAFGISQPPAFASSQTQNTMFGSGDPSIFSQNAAKPAFGTSNSSQSQFGSGTGFTFGTNSTNAQSPPSAFANTPVTTPFGSSGAAQPPSFSSAPTFNFNAAGSSSFGGNVFGATAAAKPAENAFTFGSSSVASTPAPAQQNVFQFGTAPQQAAPQSQPFTFGANPAVGGATGGFSIGAGGSSRNRTNRNRRK